MHICPSIGPWPIGHSRHLEEISRVLHEHDKLCAVGGWQPFQHTKTSESWLLTTVQMLEALTCASSAKNSLPCVTSETDASQPPKFQHKSRGHQIAEGWTSFSARSHHETAQAPSLPDSILRRKCAMASRYKGEASEATTSAAGWPE
jgi:hypothetical protein